MYGHYCKNHTGTVRALYGHCTGTVRAPVNSGQIINCNIPKLPCASCRVVGYTRPRRRRHMTPSAKRRRQRRHLELQRRRKRRRKYSQTLLAIEVDPSGNYCTNVHTESVGVTYSWSRSMQTVSRTGREQHEWPPLPPNTNVDTGGPEK